MNFLDNDDIAEPLELKVGFSYVSVENAKENLESEMLAKSFSQVRTEAEESWEKLLSKIRVIGGTEEEKETFQKNADSLTEIFRKVLNNEKLDVKVEKLKDENISSMITLSEDTRRMQDIMKMYSTRDRREKPLLPKGIGPFAIYAPHFHVGLLFCRRQGG